VLIVDLASTSALPGLDRAADHELDGILRMSVQDGKCFRGLEPAELLAALRAAAPVRATRVAPPWLWHLGWGKAFLCYALEASVG
jgi:hypothetical protein